MFYRAEANSNDELVHHLQSNGIVKTPKIISTMKAIDRAKYSRNLADAYNDYPHSIGWGATISAPHMHGMCLELFSDLLVPGARVADIGSGSGYLTACFAHLVGPTGEVIGIDVVPELVEWSKRNVEHANPSFLSSGVVKLKVGDGWELNEGMFDVIHVGAAAATLPPALVNSLKPGGRMLIPLGDMNQALYSVDKHHDGTLTKKLITGVRYVPLVKTHDASE